MTVTPSTSASGIRLVSGGSAWNRNLLTPTGIGPTSKESSSWSCSELMQSVKSAAAGAVSDTYEVAEPT